MNTSQCTRCGTPGLATTRICPKCGSRDFASSSTTAGTAPPTAKGNLLGAARAVQKPTFITEPITSVWSRQSVRFPLRQGRLLSTPVLAGILAATVGVFLFLVFSGDTLADMAVAMTPTEQDRMVTEKHVEFQQALKESLSADHPLSRKVSAIGTKLVQAIPGGTPYTYRFHVVPNRAINAYAFPGGEIFINLGMISLMTSDEQLAAVLAHEIQHVEQRHFRHGFYRGISRSILFSMALGIFGDNTADALAEFSILGHGRAQESQADLLGLKLLYGAGLPRAGMVDMLNLLAEQGGNGLTWLSTHPDSRDRATAVARQPLP